VDTFATWTTPAVYSGKGGAMTEEIGAVTGELTVHTTWIEGEAHFSVQYVGAENWFTLAGSPVPATDEAQARELHQQAVAAVQRGQGATAPAPELTAD